MGNKHYPSILLGNTGELSKKSVNLLSMVKFPQKTKQDPLKNINEISHIDTSLMSIQERSKQKISLFERSNHKLDEKRRLMLQKKWQGYSIANDLAGRLKIEEWKTNPNFNKFSRKISSKNVLRQAETIDWK